MFKVSILTIGDEICIGQILNTNAQWMAQQVSNFGSNVVTHSVIEDDKSSIFDELDRLKKFSDIILITGGLGPTHDDLTKLTLLEYFKDKLIVHEPTLEQLERFMTKRGKRMNDRIKAQALVPSHCIPMMNAIGTAPGMLFDQDGVFFIAMPGVPAEMKYIINTHFLPFLNMLYKERKPKVIIHKTLNVIGVTESDLAELIGDPKIFMSHGKLAFLPSIKGIRLRISMPAENYSIARKRVDDVRKTLYQRVGKYIFSEDENSLIKTLGGFLTKIQRSVSVAESCTGGMLGAEFTSVPGSSVFFKGGIVAYDNSIKEKLLNISSEKLEKFGAVSEEICKDMAVSIRLSMLTDYGISITGIAGPDGGTEEKPVGTIWIGLADKNGVDARRFYFSTDRAINRERAVATALSMLYFKIADNINYKTRIV